MKYDIDWLVDLERSGQHFKYLHFWGHTPDSDTQIDKSCLSQWYPSSFEHDDLEYPTAEHWMMAEKARLFDDQEMLEKILNSPHPDQAKKLGRKVRKFNSTIWEENREAIVLEGNLLKFSQHEDLKDFLLKTGTRILVEASPNDEIWGIGIDRTHEDANDPSSWPGLNLLGFVLMEVRYILDPGHRLLIHSPSKAKNNAL